MRFAVASDLLLCRLQRLVPAALVRAYADDLVVVTAGLLRELQTLHRLFEEYARISGMRLNFRKCVIVPLCSYAVQDLRAAVAARAPAWGAMAIKDQAKYFGFILGPGSGDDSWLVPLAKMVDRAATWGALGPGIFYTCEAFRTFVASVVMFVAQLRPLPGAFATAEARACSKLFPGPSNWTTAAFMTHLKSVGFPCELMDVRCSTLAAQARVAHYEDLRQGGLRVRERSRRLRDLMLNDERGVLSPEVDHWLKSNTVFVLEAAEEHVHEVERRRGLPPTRAASTEYKLRVKSTWQAARTRALLTDRPRGHVDVLVRRKLDLWMVEMPNGCRVRRFLARMQELGKAAPPCVLAAALRTSFGGWLTARRFQQRAPCAFGCASGSDCIKHYAHCGFYHRWCAEHCALARPASSRCLQNFLGLAASAGSDWTGDARTNAELDLLRACCVYALYRAHLAVRHRVIDNSDAGSFFAAALKEVCKNEPLSRLYQRSRTRGRG